MFAAYAKRSYTGERPGTMRACTDHGHGALRHGPPPGPPSFDYGSSKWHAWRCAHARGQSRPKWYGPETPT